MLPSGLGLGIAAGGTLTLATSVGGGGVVMVGGGEVSVGRCRRGGVGRQASLSESEWCDMVLTRVRPPVNVNARARKWQKKRCDKMLAKVMLYYTM